MKLRDKKVLIVGLGKSGMAARKLLISQGADICLYDGSRDADISGISEPVYLGDYPDDITSKLDLAVFSPGDRKSVV